MRELFEKATAGDKSARLMLAMPVIAFVFAVGWFNASTPVQQVIEPTPLVYASAAADSVSDSALAPSEIFVHVSGEVAKPGVYAVTNGARVFDLVAQAGGFTKKADQTSVNLARVVSDGEQLTVFQKQLSGSSQTSGLNQQNSGAAALISLNRAVGEELESLPGVGPTLAQRIIDWRTANGGFKSIEDLLEVGGIGDKLFSGLRGKVSL